MGQLEATTETPSVSALASSRVQSLNWEQQRLVSFVSRGPQLWPLSIFGDKPQMVGVENKYITPLPFSAY